MLDSTFDPADHVRPSEIARAWGLSGESVRRMIRSGKLPAVVTPSGRYLVHRDHVVLRPAASPARGTAAA